MIYNSVLGGKELNYHSILYNYQLKNCVAGFFKDQYKFTRYL